MFAVPYSSPNPAAGAGGFAAAQQQHRYATRRNLMCRVHEFSLTFTCGPECSGRVKLPDLRPFCPDYAPIVACPKCDRLLELSIGFSGGLNDIYSRTRLEFQVMTLADDALSKIPPSLLNIIKEAVRCFDSGSYYACVAMCRRLVEGIVVIKGAHGRTLKDKIDNLGNRRLISQRVECGDMYVRSLGNIACHFHAIPKDEITYTEASICLRTAYNVLTDVFLGAGNRLRVREEHNPGGRADG